MLATGTARARLTERDTQVLVAVYKHRYLSVSQIQRLYFPSLQTTYRRLRALSASGHVESFTAPNISEHMYYLSEPGATVVAAALGVAVADLKWRQADRAPKDYYFLQHFLKVNDFRIALTEGCAGSTDLRLLGFIPEYYGRKTESGGLSKYIRDTVCDIHNSEVQTSHTPDAVFALGKGDGAALFFLEIDRGTETVSCEDKGVLKCASFYLQYLVSKKYERYQHDFRVAEFKGFRALIVTTSPVRVRNIREAVTNLAFIDKAKRFIWLTTHAELEASGLLSPIWRSADVRDDTLYRIG